MNSQFDEEKLISDYFGNEVGTLLSIGENDGKTLSNVYSCLQNKWIGTLVEPSPEAFRRLSELYKDRLDVQLFNVAIGENSGDSILYESGTDLEKGDVGLLSTLKKEEMIARSKQGKKFHEVKVPVITFKELIASSKIKLFDLVSIDAEGMDWDILKQIDLSAIGCRMLIVEYNGQNESGFTLIAEKYGMTLLSKNSCNLIFTFNTNI